MREKTDQYFWKSSTSIIILVVIPIILQWCIYSLGEYRTIWYVFGNYRRYGLRMISKWICHNTYLGTKRRNRWRAAPLQVTVEENFNTFF